MRVTIGHEQGRATGNRRLSDDSLTMNDDKVADAERGGAGLLVRAGRLWRQFGTGLCFVVYGLFSWLGGMVVLPLILLWPGSAITRERRIRKMVSLSFRALLGLIALLRVGSVRVEGREWLKQAGGKLVVANHPMYLDMMPLVGFLPQADCVIKGAMMRNPLYRRFLQAGGYIGNDGGAQLVADAVASLRRGRTLILFPEGTRSTPGKPLKFCRGAAQMAVRSQCEIVPVIIQCEPLALGKGQAWHVVGDKPWRLILRICPPQALKTFDWDEDMPHGVAARHVTRAMQNFFTAQLASLDGAGNNTKSGTGPKQTGGQTRRSPCGSHGRN